MYFIVFSFMSHGILRQNIFIKQMQVRIMRVCHFLFHLSFCYTSTWLLNRYKQRTVCSKKFLKTTKIYKSIPIFLMWSKLDFTKVLYLFSPHLGLKNLQFAITHLHDHSLNLDAIRYYMVILRDGMFQKFYRAYLNLLIIFLINRLSNFYTNNASLQSF